MIILKHISYKQYFDLICHQHLCLVTVCGLEVVLVDGGVDVTL